MSLAKLRISRASRASAPISSISASTVPSSSRARRRLSRAVAAALNFARCSWVNFRPRLAFATLPAMAARSSGDLSAQRARPREAIFARVSAVSFFPRTSREIERRRDGRMASPKGARLLDGTVDALIDDIGADALDARLILSFASDMLVPAASLGARRFPSLSCGAEFRAVFWREFAVPARSAHFGAGDGGAVAFHADIIFKLA